TKEDSRKPASTRRAYKMGYERSRARLYRGSSRGGARGGDRLGGAKSEIDLVGCQSHPIRHHESMTQLLVRRPGDDQALDAVASFGEVPGDPSHVAQDLADRRVARLVALQLDHQPGPLRLVVRQKVDFSNARARIAVTGHLAVRRMEGPVGSERG